MSGVVGKLSVYVPSQIIDEFELNLVEMIYFKCCRENFILDYKLLITEHFLLSKMAVFWVVAMMMKAASISETSVNFHQTTRCNNPEDSHLHTRRRENLKYHSLLFISPVID
jgi:hypothetical protein